MSFVIYSIRVTTVCGYRWHYRIRFSPGKRPAEKQVLPEGCYRPHREKYEELAPHSTTHTYLTVISQMQGSQQSYIFYFSYKFHRNIEALKLEKILLYFLYFGTKAPILPIF